MSRTRTTPIAETRSRTVSRTGSFSPPDPQATSFGSLARSTDSATTSRGGKGGRSLVLQRRRGSHPKALCPSSGDHISAGPTYVPRDTRRQRSGSVMSSESAGNKAKTHGRTDPRLCTAAILRMRARALETRVPPWSHGAEFGCRDQRPAGTLHTSTPLASRSIESEWNAAGIVGGGVDTACCLVPRSELRPVASGYRSRRRRAWSRSEVFVPGGKVGHGT